MEGVERPSLLIPPGATPHEHVMRPSEATALKRADVIFWVGEDLTPWLEGALETLAEGAEVVQLLEVEGVALLEVREDALFEEDVHEDEGGHGAEAMSGEHSEDEHGDEDMHGGERDADHPHGAFDPHAWLSPDNAAAWLDAIATRLAEADPANAGTYLLNTFEGREEIASLKAEIDGMLTPVRGLDFGVFHDAYQYFERAFDIPASGAIALGDAASPGPARIAEIQARVLNEGIDFVLSEPQFNASIVETVLEGTDARTGVWDPLGSGLEPGSELYPTVMRGLAAAFATCR